jgi:transcription antitermination factor NusG
MKKFLAVFIGTPESRERAGWDQMDQAKRQALEAKGMKAWGDWVTTHAKVIVDHGGPLGKTKRIARNGVSDIRNNMGGYTIVEAESHEAAARLFENHPHFTIFPGDSVEIMERLPIPGQ